MRDLSIRKEQDPLLIREASIKTLFDIVSALPSIISSERVARKTQINQAVGMHKIHKDIVRRGTKIPTSFLLS